MLLWSALLLRVCSCPHKLTERTMSAIYATGMTDIEMHRMLPRRPPPEEEEEPKEKEEEEEPMGEKHVTFSELPDEEEEDDEEKEAAKENQRIEGRIKYAKEVRASISLEQKASILFFCEEFFAEDIPRLTPQGKRYPRGLAPEVEKKISEEVDKFLTGLFTPEQREFLAKQLHYDNEYAHEDSVAMWPRDVLFSYIFDFLIVWNDKDAEAMCVYGEAIAECVFEEGED